MRYAITRYNQHQRDLAYRIYVTNCLRITTENTAKTVLVTSQGKIEANYVSANFVDTLNHKSTVEKTEQQIIDEMQAEFERLGFELVE